MHALFKSLLGELLERAKESGVAFTAVELVEDSRDAYREYLKEEYHKHNVERTAEEVGSGLWVGGKSSVNSRTRLGDNVHFLGMSVHGDGRVAIGDNFHSGSGCMLITEDHNYDSGDAIPYDGTVTREPVEIGDNVWFGRNVIVLPGVSIAEGAVVQAGSVVTEDVPRGAVAGGHPAEVFKYRDMDHYEKLKAEGEFH